MEIGTRAVEDGGIPMAHTYSNQIFHIVFSTQGHIPLIKAELKRELFAYMGALVKELKGYPLEINGVADHIHMLIVLPPNVSTSDALRFIKANSSRWFKSRSQSPFAWQKGFGVFSVSRSAVDQVVKYIQNQETHHAKQSFRDEFVSLLEKHGVDYDPEFLWK